jgi:hypothetical protein
MSAFGSPVYPRGYGQLRLLTASYPTTEMLPDPLPAAVFSAVINSLCQNLNRHTDSEFPLKLWHSALCGQNAILLPGKANKKSPATYPGPEPPLTGGYARNTVKSLTLTGCTDPI